MIAAAMGPGEVAVYKGVAGIPGLVMPGFRALDVFNVVADPSHEAADMAGA